MSETTTPGRLPDCPPWCVEGHASKYDAHVGHLGQVLTGDGGLVRVRIVQDPGAPAPQVVLSALPLNGSTHVWLPLGPGTSAPLADMLAILGHADLAAYIRQAASLTTGSSPGGAP